MLYDWTATAALGSVQDLLPREPVTLTGVAATVLVLVGVSLALRKSRGALGDAIP